MRENLDKDIPIRIEAVTEPAQALEDFLAFAGALKREFSSKRYWGERIMRLVAGTTQGLRAYEAKSGADTIGMVLGHDKGDFLLAKFLAVHPRYQHTGTAERLMKAMKADFGEIRLVADAFGEDLSQDEKKNIARQDALFRVYEKMGFMPAGPKGFSNYQEAQQTGEPLRMVWKRDTKDTV